MSKFGSFVFGVVVGAAASLVATTLLTPDTVEELTDSVKNQTKDLKDKALDLKNQAESKVSSVSGETLDNLKKKYDNSTDLIKSQLQSFPKQVVNDDSELTDFDDIIIDDTEAFTGDPTDNDRILNELNQEQDKD